MAPPEITDEQAQNQENEGSDGSKEGDAAAPEEETTVMTSQDASTTSQPAVTSASNSQGRQPRPVKRAQRTQKVKVNDASKSENAVNAAPATNAAKPKNSKDAGKKGTKSAEDEQEGEGTEEDEEVDSTEEEPSKIMTGLICLGQGLLETVLRFLKSTLSVLITILSFFRRIVVACRYILVPVTALLLFLGTAYLLAEFVLSEPTKGHLNSFSDRMHYVIEASVFNFFLIGLVSLVQQWDQNHSAHRLFLANTFDDSVLLLVNCALLATHLETAYMHWLQALLHTAAIFRFLYWFGLMCHLNGLHSFFNTSRTTFNFALLSYNLGVIVGRDLGYITAGACGAGEEASAEEKSEDPWSVCNMMEKYICGVHGMPF